MHDGNSYPRACREASSPVDWQHRLRRRRMGWQPSSSKMDPPPRREKFEFEEADASNGCEVASPAQEVTNYGLAGVGRRWLAPDRRYMGQKKIQGRHQTHWALATTFHSHACTVPCPRQPHRAGLRTAGKKGGCVFVCSPAARTVGKQI